METPTERSLRLDTTDWSRAQVHRQYPATPAGDQAQAEEASVLSAHGYEPVARTAMDHIYMVTYGRPTAPREARLWWPSDTAAAMRASTTRAPAVSPAEVVRSLQRDSTDWTRATVHRQYPAGADGEAKAREEEAVLRTHGYTVVDRLPMGHVVMVTYNRNDRPVQLPSWRTQPAATSTTGAGETNRTKSAGSIVGGILAILLVAGLVVSRSGGSSPAATGGGGSGRCEVPLRTAADWEACSASYIVLTEDGPGNGDRVLVRIAVAPQDPSVVVAALAQAVKDRAGTGLEVSVFAFASAGSYAGGSPYDRGHVLLRDGRAEFDVCTGWDGIGLCDRHSHFAVDL